MIPRGDSSIALIKRLNVRIGRVTSIYTKASALGSYVVGSRSLLAQGYHAPKKIFNTIHENKMLILSNKNV